MKILSNKSTNEIAKISNFDTKNNRVFVSLYDYPLQDNPKNQIYPIEGLQEKCLETVCLEDYCLNEIKTKYLVDYVLEEVNEYLLDSEGNQLLDEKDNPILNEDINWLVDNRPIRLIMDNELFVKCMSDSDDLAVLVQTVYSTLPNEAKINNKSFPMVYLEEIYPEHEDLLKISGIVIQKK